MDWISRHGQSAAWICFALAFLTFLVRPDRVVIALPLYVIASLLFIAVIVVRSRKDTSG